VIRLDARSTGAASCEVRIPSHNLERPALQAFGGFRWLISWPDGLIVQANSKQDPERHFLPVFEGVDFLGTGANYVHPSKRNLLFLAVAS